MSQSRSRTSDRVRVHRRSEPSAFSSILGQYVEVVTKEREAARLKRDEELAQMFIDSIEKQLETEEATRVGPQAVDDGQGLCIEGRVVRVISNMPAGANHLSPNDLLSQMFG